jgi:hypothetical protein
MFYTPVSNQFGCELPFTLQVFTSATPTSSMTFMSHNLASSTWSATNHPQCHDHQGASHSGTHPPYEKLFQQYAPHDFLDHIPH